MGHWDGNPETPRLARLHAYQSLFDYQRLFVGRKIAQLPTICRAPDGAAFQDTVIIIQLSTDLPLDAWVLARPIQWFAAKVARSGIIEDLGSSWHKRQYLSLPVPPAGADLSELVTAGQSLLETDRHAADGERRVKAAIQATTCVALSAMAADGDARTAGLDARTLIEGPVCLGDTREEGSNIKGDDPRLDIGVPDDSLRRYLLYALAKLKDEGAEVLSLTDLQAIPIPRDTEAVLDAVERSNDRRRKQEFDDALSEVDRLAGLHLGLTDYDVAMIT